MCEQRNKQAPTSTLQACRTGQGGQQWLVEHDPDNLTEKRQNLATGSTAGSSGRQPHLSNKNTNSCSVICAAKDLKVVLLDQQGSDRVQDATLRCGSQCVPPPLHCACATLNC